MKKLSLSLGLVSLITACTSQDSLVAPPTHHPIYCVPKPTLISSSQKSKSEEARSLVTSLPLWREQYDLESGVEFALALATWIRLGTIKVDTSPSGAQNFHGGLSYTDQDFIATINLANTNNDRYVTFKEAQSYLETLY